MKKRILIIIACVMILLAGGMAVYACDYYHAEDPAACVASTDTVTVSKTGSDYLFDGPGSGTLLIFYPGGKVEDIAYAPLLKRIAAGGIDCCLVHMPLNLAVFGSGRATEIMQKLPYERYLIGGHSLGGAMAASYAADHPDSLGGLVLLAAYPSKTVTGMTVLSVCGSEDRVVNRERMAGSADLVQGTYTEHVIEGGNHCGFGCYGHQNGDGTASVTADEQQRITAELILTAFVE